MTPLCSKVSAPSTSNFLRSEPVATRTVFDFSVPLLVVTVKSPSTPSTLDTSDLRGSGFILRKNNKEYAVTNYHVIDFFSLEQHMSTFCHYRN